METLAYLLAALCVNEFAHNCFELWGIRQKLVWLELTNVGKPHGTWPLNIDTKWKTYVLHTVLLVFFTGVSFLLLKLLVPDAGRVLSLAIFVLLINYVYVVKKTDTIHTHLGGLIRPAKRQKRS